MVEIEFALSPSQFRLLAAEGLPCWWLRERGPSLEVQNMESILKWWSHILHQLIKSESHKSPSYSMITRHIITITLCVIETWSHNWLDCAYSILPQRVKLIMELSIGCSFTSCNWFIHFCLRYATHGFFWLCGT